MKKAYIFLLSLLLLPIASGCKKHIHDFVNEVVDEMFLKDPATCTKKAIYYKSCLCGEKSEETFEAGDPLGHTPSEWITSLDSTCSKEGKKYIECLVCHEILAEEIIAKLNHISGDPVKENIIEPTCEENGSYSSVIYCQSCNIKLSEEKIEVEPLGHSFTNYIKDNNATCYKDGTLTAKCDRCSATDTITDPNTKLTHNYVLNNKTEKYECSHCGDSFDAYYYVSFYLDNTFVSSQKILYKNKANDPFVAREFSLGYTYSSWLDGDGNIFNFNNEITSSINLYSYTKIDYGHMPVINVNTNGVSINSKEEYTSALISIENAQDKYIFNNVEAGIRLRGNSTLLYKGLTKFAYRLKFEKKQKMLGLNNDLSAKSWVLLADVFDQSLSRNLINFYLGNKFNYYCSDFKYVELHINGVYKGVYLLCEQQQINKGRINIEEYDEKTSDPINTGYLLENDYFYYMDEPYYIECNINNQVYPFTHWLVKSDTTSSEQLTYIRDYMQNIYDILYSSAVSNPEIIANYLDISSAVDMSLQQLINCNTDVNSSFYVFKDKNDVLKFGAPWDADMAFGNQNANAGYDCLNQNSSLLQPLFNQNWFKQLLKTRFFELELDKFGDEITSLLSSNKDIYKKEFDRNYIIGNYRGGKSFSAQVVDAKNWKNTNDAIDYVINYLNNHIDFLTNYLANI